MRCSQALDTLPVGRSRVSAWHAVARTRRLFSFSLLAAIATGCAGDVARVHPTVTSARLERASRVGSPVSQEDIEDIERISESILAVSVDGGREIWLVGWDGSRMSIVARRGRGPGEVEGAVWIVRLTPDEFVAVDVLLRRAIAWGADGKMIREWAYDLPAVTGVWASQGRLVLRTTSDASGLDFVTLDATGATIGSRRFPSLAESPQTSCRYCPAAVGQDGTIAMAVSDTSYRWILTGMAQQKTRLVEGPAFAAVPSPPHHRDSIADLWRAIGERLSERGAPAEATARVGAIASAPGRAYLRRFVSRTAMFDDEGRFYVQRTGLAGDSVQVDAFSPDLAFASTYLLPPLSVLRRAYDTRLLVTRTLPDGSTVIEEYSRSPRSTLR